MSTGGGGGVLDRYLGGKVPPAHTLILFKTQNSDFATLKKTVFFILLPFLCCDSCNLSHWQIVVLLML